MLGGFNVGAAGQWTQVLYFGVSGMAVFGWETLLCVINCSFCVDLALL